MANDGQIVFEITADGKHAIADIKDVTRVIQQESTKWDKAAKESTTNIDNSFSSMLKKIAAGFSAAKIGKMLLDIGKDALQAASDLAEVQNVVDVTFGDGASKIERWAKTATTQFGLTETQAKKFASTMGAMMKSSGLAGDEIIDMSTNLAGLAADMSSFYNLDFDTAFQKIRSGISGETEPLKQLGINMSVANLEAYALSKGITKAFNDMSQGEQTMLRYQYLMQATADAQGDFARTSDGYANSLRLAQTNIDAIKTKLGELLIGPASQALTWVNEFLGKITSTGERTVLDDFQEIDVDTSGKLSKLNTQVQDVKDYIKVLSDLFGGGVTGDKIVDTISKMGVKSKEAEEYLRSLGYSTEEIEDIQNKWLVVCENLVKTIPGLSDVIDTENGKINGGTTALYSWIDAYEDTMKRKIAIDDLAAKKEALNRKYAELPGMWAEVAYWQPKLNAAQEQLSKWYGTQFDEKGNITNYGNIPWNTSTKAPSGKTVNEEFKYYEDLRRTTAEVVDTYEEQNKAYEQSIKYIDELTENLGELTEEEKKVVDGTDKVTEAQEEAGAAATKTAKEVQEAIDAYKKYAEDVYKSVSNTVDGVIKGFNSVETEAGKLREKSAELAGQETETISKYFDVFKKWGNSNDSLRRMADNWDRLSSAEREAYNALAKIRNEQKETNDALKAYTPEGMKDALASQLKYMTEYMANIDKAKKMGLSEDLIAFLSDGSTESAEMLAGLIAGGKDAAQEVDKAFQEVKQTEAQFKETLTNEKLTADDVYQSMVAEAQAAAAALDVSEQTKASSQKTGEGIAQGIAGAIPAVQQAVNDMLSVLSQLDGWSLNLDIGPSSSTTTSSPVSPTTKLMNNNLLKPTKIGGFAIGLDYVPFDGFLASLHEGEGILTAEENRIWQRFVKGGTGIDYDAMGGVMRDNIRPGGNVYLDGRIVGSVISEQQGRSYRQLQRSGWQG